MGTRAPRVRAARPLRRPCRLHRGTRRAAVALGRRRDRAGRPLRSSRRRLQQRRQHAAALEREGDGRILARRVQQGLLRGGRRAQGACREPHEGALPERQHDGRQGAAPPPAVLLRVLFAGGHPAPLPRGRQRLVAAAREGVHPPQRDAPRARDPGTHAHPRGRGGHRLGGGLGPDVPHDGLHEPHDPPRGAGEVARPDDGASAAAPSADHLRDQRTLPQPRLRHLPRRPGPPRADVPHRRGRRALRAHGEPRDHRFLQRQRRCRAPHGNSQGVPLQGLLRADAGPLPQRDERHHAAPVASEGEPAARAAHHREDRHALDHPSRRTEEART